MLVEISTKILIRYNIVFDCARNNSFYGALYGVTS